MNELHTDAEVFRKWSLRPKANPCTLMIWAHLLKGQPTLSYGKISIQGINDNQYKNYTLLIG